MKKRGLIIYYIFFLIITIGLYSFFVATKPNAESLYMIMLFSVTEIVFCPIISVISAISLWFALDKMSLRLGFTVITILIFFILTTLCFWIAGNVGYEPIGPSAALAALNSAEMLVIHGLCFFILKIMGDIRMKKTRGSRK